MAIYTVSPSELDATLASAPANTVDTPHIINLTFINTYTVSNVTVKTALQNNPSKFVSLTILRCDDYGIDTSYMLNACTSLIAVDVSLCKIGNCTAMFSSCNNLRSVKIGLVGLISSVNSSCNYMFQGCSSLTEIIGIRCAATRNPCYRMFQNCSSLKEINLSNFKVSYSESMFEGCSSLETIVLGDQTGVTTAVKMFKDCTSLEEIHGWSIPLTATMTDCFTNCDSLQAIYVPEVIPQESTWHAWEMSKDTVNSQTAVKVYDLDGTSVSVNVPSTGTYSIKVTDKVDELIFASTAGTITSAMIQKMLQIKAPITGRESALDPTNDNFVLWAKNQQAIKTNIVTNVVEANNPLPPSSAAVHAAIAGGIPTGTILDYPGTIAPAGFALCIGQTAMRSEYINLIQWAIENDLIGENKLFGDGDGVSTFEFPDLREVVLVGSGKNERYVFDNTELDPATGTAGTQAHDIYNVGEFKDDQMQKITGTFESARAASAGNTTGAFYTSSEFSSDYLIGASGSAVRHSVYGLDTSRVVRAGTVTHSKQIGMNYIIRC